MIKKILTTVVRDKNFLPSNINISFQVMRENSPGWQLLILSDKEIEAYMKTEFKKYYPIFLMTDDDTARNLFKLLWIYYHGGVWIDAKVFWAGSLDNFIGEKDIAITAKNKDLEQSTKLDLLFGFQEKHHILKTIIEQALQDIVLGKKIDYNIFREELKKADDMNIADEDSKKIVWNIGEAAE